MGEVGLEGYMFSISWPRLIPSMIGYNVQNLKSKR